MATSPDTSMRAGYRRARADFATVGTIAGLSLRTIGRLLQAGKIAATLQPDLLDESVGRGILDTTQARSFAMAAAVYMLVDRDPAVTSAIHAATRTALADKSAGVTEILARMRADAIRSALEAANVPPVGGETIAARSERIGLRFAALHPGISFFDQLPMLSRAVVARWIEQCKPLFERNERVFRAAWERLNLNGLSDAIRAQLAAVHREAVARIRAYVGLGLAELFDDNTRSPNERGEQAERRVGLVQHAAKTAGHDAALRLDYGPRAGARKQLGLEADGISEAEAAAVIRTFKGYQRCYTVAASPLEAARLAAAGYASARQMARDGEKRVSDLAHVTPERAAIIVARAGDVAGDAATVAGALLDRVNDWLDGSGGGNVPPSTDDEMGELEGIDSLFGAAGYCACKACNSILGPAAYFVDLMAFVDEHLRSQLEGHPDHSLDLRTRRPELWTLELTCANTNERLPLLAIVNEVLEAHVARERGFAGTEEERRRQVYALLAAADGSFHQPFDLSRARVAACLAHMESDRAEVAEAVAADGRTRASAALELSGVERTLVASADADLATLSRRYGIAFEIVDALVRPVDAAVLGPRMGLSREQLGEVVGTDFVAVSGAAITIVAEKRDDESVQNDIENVHGLNPAALDRMHRFARLQRRLPWSVPDLDRILGSMGALDLTDATIDAIADALWVSRALRTRVDETAAIVGRMSGLLFDQVFNSPGVVAAGGVYPQDTVRFVHPALRETTVADPDPNLGRLQAALGLSVGDLGNLVAGLASELGFSLGSSEDQRGFLLTRSNLGLLYRYARLARALGLTVSELLQLLAVFEIASPIDGATQVRTIIDAHSWVRRSGYSLDDVAVATGKPARDPSRYADPALLAQTVVDGAPAALELAPTALAVATGISEPAALAVVVANPHVLVTGSSADRYRLADGLDLASTPITIPPGVIVPHGDGPRPLTDDDVRLVLASYAPGDVLARRLASVLRVAAARIEAMSAFTGIDLASAGLAEALREEEPAPVMDVIVRLRSARVAFAASVWTEDAIVHVSAHGQAYDVPSPGPLTVASMRALAGVARLLSNQDPLVLHAVLEAYVPAGSAAGFPLATVAPMARLLGTSAGVIHGLRPHIALGTSAVASLLRFARASALVGRLGIDGDLLGAVVSASAPEQERAADALLAAVSARGGEEARRRVEEPLLERRRDALVDYVTRTLHPDRFEDTAALSSHFLLDLEAGGCQSTSRVISATGVAQQYVQRVILGLEQDGRAPDDPGHAELRMPPTALLEWSWRKNYRVWEANRKVFLWPENYLDPDLRDDKTPLCEALERELFQTDVSENDVSDAYATYLKGFEELANLSIAGAYQDTDADELHLFGVTADDPPAFYYRRCDGLLASGRDAARGVSWGHWHRVELQIGARRVAPIVIDKRLHVFWVDARTRSVNTVVTGNSRFDGYHHTLRMYVTTLRPDGNWTPPQEIVLPRDATFSQSAGRVVDELINGRPRLDDRVHTEPLDDYGVSGANWIGVWPEIVNEGGQSGVLLGYRNFFEYGMPDLYRRTIGHTWRVLPPPPPLICARGTALYRGVPTSWFWGETAMANVVVDERRLNILDRESPGAKALLQQGLYLAQVANVRGGAELLSVPGNIEDAIVQVGADVVLLQGTLTSDSRYIARRLGTTLASDIGQRLFSDGIDGLLDSGTQATLREAGLPLTSVAGQVIDRGNAGRLDFTGPYGTYYRELFLHVPLMIAQQLSARGRFAEAQRWLSVVFDPTSTEVIDVPAGTSPAERQRRIRDRVWRYLEFRRRNPDSLRWTLTDPEAIEKYRTDPFNPHAIARLRLSAYQRGVIFAYVDNLLDWADHLFTQFTMESVGEAMTLYRMAADVLGERPQELGDCGEGAVQPRTYEAILPLLDGPDDLLVELETWSAGRRYSERPAGSSSTRSVDPSRIAHAAAIAEVSSVPRGASTEPASPPLAAATTRRATMAANGIGPARMRRPSGAARGFAYCAIRQASPVFCLPPNRGLLERWDRVTDRLFKIRHCLDIEGKPRELALLAPELDVRAVARMKAEGLTLDDVAVSTTGSLPPYRFLYLVDRAKALASTVAGLGSALLGALEKRDGESLARLRTVHQQTLTQMTTRHREWEIEIAEESLDASQKQREAAEYRANFHRELLAENRSGWESAQSLSRHLASAAQGLVAAPMALAAVAALLPQVGSPFSMNYGGYQLSAAWATAAHGLQAGAQLAEMLGASAGLEASFDRRREGWEHQEALARRDIAILDRNLAAAKLRVDIAHRALEIHREGVEQVEEVLALMDGRFTSRGLFTWMSQILGRLYRDAYLNALAMARLAEEAYRFERGGDPAAVLSPSHWEPGKAGLLAGERLLVELQTLERRFMESHHRRYEIDQTFSMQQIAPAALVQLRETGSCELEIPEFYFDLYYPGQLRRRIRGVRVTMPCITGPFVNVGLRLDLVSSWMRMNAAPGAPLVEVPPRRTTTMATSTAQNDAGVFELSFRDERYMPFEGAGAVSRWRFTLPKVFRPFEYQTLTDVILSISYEADHDDALRTRVEAESAQLEGSLLHWIANNPVARVLSLRQDFSPTWTRVLNSPVGTDVRFEIGARHFPVFAQGKALDVTRAVVAIRVADGVDASALRLSIDGAEVSAFASDSSLGGVLAAPLPPAFIAGLRGEHRIAVTAAAGLQPNSGQGALDPAKVLDTLLHVAYRIV